MTVVKVDNKNTTTMSCCFIFNFEHVQQINLFYFIVNFEHAFASWAQDIIHKATYEHIKQSGSFFKTCTYDE